MDLADDECQWMESYDFDGEKFWRSQEGTFHCLEKNLKSIKIYGHITEPYVIDMIEFLLKNAMVLEKLEISSQNTFRPFPKTNCCPRKVELTTEQRQEFSRKVFSLPRASTSA
ncbi:F-box/LRR-repeat protein, partial [Corchorus capsularis]